MAGYDGNEIAGPTGQLEAYFFRVALALVCIIFSFALPLSPARARTPSSYSVPVMGQSRLAFDSNPAYINDHAVFKAEDGTWHMIGITHDKILGGLIPVPLAENEFAHAIAADISADFSALDNILEVDKSIGETHVWAPHVVFHNGLYYCFYAGGGKHTEYMLNLATSPDLLNWTRHPQNPLFKDFFDARDPMILKVRDKWVMYYTKTYSRDLYLSTVAYRLSEDLVNWSEPDFALTLEKMEVNIINSGHTESPFVILYDGLYYMFICTPDMGYRNTRVFVSDDPFDFNEDDEITTLIAHCAEVVVDSDDYYLSHAGWFFDGMYLAPLTWQKVSRSPSMSIADSGDNKDFLVSAPWAMKKFRGMGRALVAGPGQTIEYVFPIPDNVGSINLVFEEVGETWVSANGKTILDESGQGKGQPTIHTIDLTDRSLWADGQLQVVFKNAGPDFFNRPAITFVKLYHR